MRFSAHDELGIRQSLRHLLLTVGESIKAFKSQLICYCHTSLQGIACTACPVQVATTLHRLEQAKYWSGLKQRHNSQVLASKQRSAIEGQMANCMRSTQAPPAAELVAMVQAGCEEEVCLFIVPALQGYQSIVMSAVDSKL